MKTEVKRSIDLADETTVKMIQAMLKVQQQENEANTFEDEIDRRFAEMERGENSTILTIDEFFERAKNRREHKQSGTNE